MNFQNLLENLIEFSKKHLGPKIQNFENFLIFVLNDAMKH